MERCIDVRLRLHYEPRSLRLLLIAGLLVSATGDLASESVSLTTYYPAPSGVYTQLIATSNSFLARDGGAVGVGTATPGSLANSKFTIDASGFATALTVQEGSQPFFALNPLGGGGWQMYDGNGGGWNARVTDSGGNIGINTTGAPARTLDVNGPGMFVSPNGGSTGGVIIRDAPGNPNAAYLQFTNNADSIEYSHILGMKTGGLVLTGPVDVMPGSLNIPAGNLGVEGYVPGGESYVYVNAANNSCFTQASNNAPCPGGMYVTWVAGLYVDNQWWSSGPDFNITGGGGGQYQDITTTSPTYYCCWK